MLPLALLAAACGRSPPAAAPGDGRPDIVLIVWDTTRADRLSCYGFPRPTTPFVDSLAARGVRFEDCTTTAPWTPAAHASLFTGLPPAKHGLVADEGDRLREGVTTVASRLKAAGYETVGFSANLYVGRFTGLDRGFDRFLGFRDMATPEKTCEGDVVLSHVRTWLAERAADPKPDRPPVFLFVNLMDAHLPLLPQQGAVDRLGFTEAEVARLDGARAVTQPLAMGHALGIRRLDDDTLAGLADLYAAAVAQLDDVTGAMLASLRDAGIGTPTDLVVITADHGEMLGEQGLLEHRWSLYEPVLRVPLILAREGSFDGGHVLRRPVSLMDVPATLLLAAKAPRGPADNAMGPALHLREEPGLPQLSHFLRPQGSGIGFVRKSFPEATDRQVDPVTITLDAVRAPPGPEGRFKYIRGRRGKGREPGTPSREELYDLSTDPGEEKNLLALPTPETSRARAKKLAETLPPDPPKPK